jgi:hypothetical protein
MIKSPAKAAKPDTCFSADSASFPSPVAERNQQLHGFALPAILASGSETALVLLLMPIAQLTLFKTIPKFALFALVDSSCFLELA